jgi:acetyl esterase/lipase
LSFWQFRFTEFHPVRRIFSVSNPNDFSWRNRVAAWEGAMDMMADRPWVGFGWNQTERIYDQFYRPPKVSEGMAIQLNHYFILGMSLGLPALICFAAYLGLSLMRSAERGTWNANERNRKSQIVNHKWVCRGGAVVLLVGLWFDGGLFNLATGALLWVLVELGRVAQPPASCGEAEGELVSHRWRDSRFNPPPVAVFGAALLLTGMIWARSRDPFHREWLSLKTHAGQRFSAAVVMPDRGGPFPVVVWCHGSGGSLIASGETLRQFAALGLAAVGFEYDQTNQADFDAQLAGLLADVPKHEWARRGAVAWAGNSLGAQRQLSCLVRHPELRPAVLVRLNGGMVDEVRAVGENSTSNTQQPTLKVGEPISAAFGPQPSTFPGLSVWLAHGENDAVFSVNETRQVAAWLRTAGAEVRLDVFPGRGHNFGEDQPLLVRQAAEFSADAFGGTRIVPVNVRPGLGCYWLPAGLFGSWLIIRRPRGRRQECRRVSDRRLCIIALGTTTIALGVSALHLALPQCPANPVTLRLARGWCVAPELRADFDWLADQPEAGSCRVGELLEHLSLASLQRGQFGTSLSDAAWREFVLSPWIQGANGNIGWRRELWEWLAPRVRRETSVAAAAQIVARELRRRICLKPQTSSCTSLTACWAAGQTDASHWGPLRVAALRSAGVPAKLDAAGDVQILASGTWQRIPPTFDESPGILPAAAPGAVTAKGKLFTAFLPAVDDR